MLQPRAIKRTTCSRLVRCFNRLLLDSSEHFDSKAEVIEKALIVADKLANSKHAIAFCGAGLSTKSGIPDYRSGLKTVLETGPGKWALEESKEKYTKQTVKKSSTEAWPNDGHKAIASLVKNGYLKFVISQNVDGLLSKIGVPDDKMSELHGNIFKEYCTSCGKVFWRDFSIPNWETKDHTTGRNCDCGHTKPIRDTLVYFGDSLKKEDIQNASTNVAKSDFCMVLGSSVQVFPAARYVSHFYEHKPPGSLAIVNLQKTTVHGKGAIEAHDFVDSFLIKVLDALHITPVDNKFVRTLTLVQAGDGKMGHHQLTFKDSGARFVQSCQNFTLRSKINKTNSKVLDKWPFEISDADIKEYDEGEFTFIFYPQKSFKFDLKKLSERHQHRYTFRYDWNLNFESDETIYHV